MHTNTWKPAPAIVDRPGWPQVVGWYFAGIAATGASWTVIGVFAEVVSASAATLFGHVLAIGAIIGLIRYSGKLPRRSRVALWLGVITPFLLAAAAFAYLLWAFAHSDWQF